MIDRLEGVERATELAAAIGGDNDLKRSVQSHSFHRFATVKQEVNL